MRTTVLLFIFTLSLFSSFAQTGITWTAQVHAEANQWLGVTFGNGLFVAVSSSGTNRVMTSGMLFEAPIIPTLSQWGLIVLGLFLSVLGIVAIRSRILE